MNIAIIGGGPCGATLVREFIQSPLTRAHLHIDLYDPRESWVVGQAYQADTQEAIMNEHARDLSFDEDLPMDFLNWLAYHYPELNNWDTFVPRSIYGQYLHDRLYPYLQDDRVSLCKEWIIDLERIENRYHLHMKSGKTAGPYDAVFLAIGHPPYADRYDLLDSPGYIHQPFPLKDRLVDYDPDLHYGIIGSGLSSLDMVKYLARDLKVTRPIRMYIHNEDPFRTVKHYRYRHELKQSFSDHWIQTHRDAFGYVPLDSIVTTFLDDLADNDIDIDRLIADYGQGSIQQVRDALAARDEEMSRLRRYIVAMTPFIPDLYNAMPPLDRERYHEHYEDIFNHFRAQMPAESLQYVLDLMDTGQLELVTLLESIEPTDNGFKLTTQSGDDYHADVLLNAAGFQYDVLQSLPERPLLTSLYQREWLVPYYRGGIMVTWPDCQLITANEGLLDNVFLMGHWITSIHYGNNNIHLIIKQAARVAQAWLASTNN